MTYRSAFVRFLWAYCSFLLLMVAAIVGNTFAESGAGAGLVFGIAAASPVAVMLVRLMLVRFVVDESGVTIVNPVRRRHVPWDQIESFSLDNLRTKVVTKGGKRLDIFAVRQRNVRRAFRDDSPEKRWVAEWNARLAGHPAGRIPPRVCPSPA